MSNKFLSLRLRPGNAISRLVKWRTVQAREQLDQLMGKYEEFGIKTLKKYTPVKSGRLRNSITTIEKKKTSSGNIDMRSGITIGSRLPYGNFVDKGTKSSTGRYVPVLGRRISTGTHPGVRARNFTAVANKKIQSEGNRMFDQFGRNWRRSLRL